MSGLMELLATAVGAGYRIERELGGGGMSHVFLAEEVALGRRVVIKVLPPEMAATVNADRFRREIQLAAQLQHPAIVPLLTAGSSPDLLWYAMPFVEGESLRAKIARVGPLPMDEAVRAWRDLLEALEYAHEHAVVHRDIKPDNIMMSGRHAVAMDFGVAKAVSAATGTGLPAATQAGLAIGTPAYMSPEQAAGDTNIDGRTDLYAAGLVMYEMLAGRGPFEARTPSALMAAHLATPPTPIATHRTDIAPGLAELVMRCLAKAPEQRPANAGDVLRRLDALASEVSGARTPSATVSMAAARRNRKWMVAGALGIVAVGGSVAGARAWQARREAIAALAIGLPDSSRMVVAFVPVTRDAADSVLARNLSAAQLAVLSRDRRLSVFGDERILSVGRDAGFTQSPLDADTVVAIARDFGMHAYLARSVSRAGEGYLLTTEGKATLGDSSLFRLQVTARSAAELPAAVETISEQTLRSLRAAFGRIKRPEPYGRLMGTTPEAARLWVEGLDLFMRTDYLGVAQKMRAAARVDSQFAAGWMLLYLSLGNFGVNQDEQFRAIAAAFRHRERMRSAAFREYVTASYLTAIGDRQGSIAALQRGLQGADPSRVNILRNSLALNYEALGQPDVALPLHEETAKAEGAAPNVMTGNYVRGLLEAGRVADAERVAAVLDSTVGPSHTATLGVRAQLAYALRRPDSILAVARDRVATSQSSSTRLNGLLILRNGLATAGRMDSAQAVERERRKLYTANGNSSAIVNTVAQAALVQSEILGERAAAAQLLNDGLREARWDTMPALDRNYFIVIAARAALGETAVARQLADQWARDLPPELRTVTAPIIANARGEVALAENKGREALAQFTAGESKTCPACTWVNYARAYDAMGQPDSTIRYYEKYLGVTSSRLGGVHARQLARAYKRLGELYEAKGEAKRAIERYNDFVTLWKDADPKLQPAVEDVKARIAKLQSKVG